MITRAGAETVLTRRLGALLHEAGMAADAGLNVHLADPLAWALRALGYATASLTDVADAELLAVGAAHVDALLDLAELRCLESVAGNLTAVDVTVGPVSERRGALADRVARLLDDRRRTVLARWGPLLSQPLDAATGGPVRLLSL